MEKFFSQHFFIWCLQIFFFENLGDINALEMMMLKSDAGISLIMIYANTSRMFHRQITLNNIALWSMNQITLSALF